MLCRRQTVCQHTKDHLMSCRISGHTKLCVSPCNVMKHRTRACATPPRVRECRDHGAPRGPAHACWGSLTGGWP